MYLPCARHFPKGFADVNSLKPYSFPMNRLFYYPHVTEEKIEVCRC